MDELNLEQRTAVRLVSEGRNVFLTGDPGTGKSFTLSHICATLGDKYGHASVLKVAPTGAAALLINGQTLNSKPGPGVPQGNTQAFFRRMTPRELRWIRAVVIDEVSMLDAEFFDYYVAMFPRQIQWVLCGDFHQLAPVGKATHGLDNPVSLAHYLVSSRKNALHFSSEDAVVEYAATLDPTHAPEEWLNPEQTTPFGLQECTGKFAFQSIAWRSIAPVPVLLIKPYRTSDPVLLNGLRALRRGDTTNPDVQTLVNATNRTLVVNGEIKPTRVLPLRAAVLAANNEELAKLDASTERVFEAKDEVQVNGNYAWVKEQLEKDAFDALALRSGR